MKTATLSWLSVILLLTSPVRGEPGSQDARALFQTGKKDFVAGSYRSALARFEQAYRARSLPDILFMIGQCHRNLKQYREAMASFEGYLQKKPDAQDRALVKKLIAELEKKQNVLPSTAPLPVPEVQPASAPTARPVPVRPLPLAATRPAPRAAVSPPPLYRRWWFWTAVGVAAAAAIGTGLGVGLSAGSGGAPSGALGTLDLR